MGTLILILLIVVVAAMLAYSVYLLTLLVKAYLRLKRVSEQRDYEILLYAALPTSSVDDLVPLIPTDADPRLLANVLERIAAQNEGEIRAKAIELYQRMGLHERRLREMEKGGPREKESARQKLESLGLTAPGEKEAPAEEGA